MPPWPRSARRRPARRRRLGRRAHTWAVERLTATSPASAQSLPVSVNVSGETATIVVGSASTPIADLTLSFDDFVLSYFTTGESPQPLPVRIWSAIRFGVTPTINAIGTLMLVISLAAVALALFFQLERKTA